MISCFWNYDIIVLNWWYLYYVISWTYDIVDNITCKIIYDIMLLELWYDNYEWDWIYDICIEISWTHLSSESMITELHDIIDIWYHIWFDPWDHSQRLSAPLPPSGHVRWHIRWLQPPLMAIKWFQCEVVNIPTWTVELGRSEELSLAEARSWMKSWSLGASWAVLGAGLNDIFLLFRLFPTFRV